MNEVITTLILAVSAIILTVAGAIFSIIMLLLVGFMGFIALVGFGCFNIYISITDAISRFFRRRKNTK